MSISNLRLTRQRLGMSQKHAASELGLSPWQLGRLERGERPATDEVIHQLERLAQDAGHGLCDYCLCISTPAIPCGCPSWIMRR